MYEDGESWPLTGHDQLEMINVGDDDYDVPWMEIIARWERNSIIVVIAFSEYL